MPRSAADVRRRGDQIRRRRSALAAGGAALAVAAVAVPVFALAGNDHPKSDRNPIAKDKPVLAVSDLLRDADTEYFPGQKGAFTTASTEQGDAQASLPSLPARGPERTRGASEPHPLLRPGRRPRARHDGPAGRARRRAGGDHRRVP
ncbi:hypothetical protein G5V59_23300 [Nocardioides sp. W3-2-3]|uniref:hypothetical protein n=1 Tax=Nocardioides convexus TaxID=2712224 RepID=UPI0024185A91|nr:hypothetical protein [Nocardioides convexus]NHA01674.1 hypothetical protein [Nocardioides convexus]